MKKILLHTCCAPCTTYVHRYLVGASLEVNGLFYNPNIRPPAEWEKRGATMNDYAQITGLTMLEVPHDLAIPPGDCDQCYRTRLRRTASLANQYGYSCFTTTLLISPYQKHDRLKEIGEAAAKEFGVPFFYHDFRDAYQESRSLSRQMKLYRQKYCGCGVDLKLKGEIYAQVN